MDVSYHLKNFRKCLIVLSLGNVKFVLMLAKYTVLKIPLSAVVTIYTTCYLLLNPEFCAHAVI